MQHGLHKHFSGHVLAFITLPNPPPKKMFECPSAPPGVPSVLTINPGDVYIPCSGLDYTTLGGVVMSTMMVKGKKISAEVMMHNDLFL